MKLRRKKVIDRTWPSWVVISQTNTITGDRRYRAQLPETFLSEHFYDPDWWGEWWGTEDRARQDADDRNVSNAWENDTP